MVLFHAKQAYLHQITQLLTLAPLQRKFVVQILGQSKQRQRCQRLTTAAPAPGVDVVIAFSEPSATQEHQEHLQQNLRFVKAISFFGIKQHRRSMSLRKLKQG